MLITDVEIIHKPKIINHSINVQIPLVVEWFMESEQCVLDPGFTCEIIPNSLEVKDKVL